MRILGAWRKEWGVSGCAVRYMVRRRALRCLPRLLVNVILQSCIDDRHDLLSALPSRTIRNNTVYMYFACYTNACFEVLVAAF